MPWRGLSDVTATPGLPLRWGWQQSSRVYPNSKEMPTATPLCLGKASCQTYVGESTKDGIRRRIAVDKMPWGVS